jgi:hypothetical protein
MQTVSSTYLDALRDEREILRQAIADGEDLATLSRVNLEMFDGADWGTDNDLDAYDLGQMLRGMAEDILEGENDTMTTTDYNGWTNYATWRVNLEMFDGTDLASDNDLDAYDLGQMLRGMAEDILEGESEPSSLARGYALAFLSDVNWHEIAHHMIEAYREQDA